MGHNSSKTYLYCLALSMYSCCSITTESAAETSMMFLKDKKNISVTCICYFRVKSHIVHIYPKIKVPYCAALVRMDVRMAWSSVRAGGTIGLNPSIPFGGLLMGFGWGIRGLISSGSWKRGKGFNQTMYPRC